VGSLAGAVNGYEYALDGAGHRAAVAEDNGRSIAYTYDALHRLKSETISGAFSQNGTSNWLYDEVGNRETQTTTIPAISNQAVGYDGNDRLLTHSLGSPEILRERFARRLPANQRLPFL
jgi:YD repeat-containing protein